MNSHTPSRALFSLCANTEIVYQPGGPYPPSNSDIQNTGDAHALNEFMYSTGGDVNTQGERAFVVDGHAHCGRRAMRSHATSRVNGTWKKVVSSSSEGVHNTYKKDWMWLV